MLLLSTHKYICSVFLWKQYLLKWDNISTWIDFSRQPGFTEADDPCNEPDPTPNEGEEGGDCFPNETCNSGLVCQDDVCTPVETGD